MNNYRTEDDFYFHEKFGKVPIGWDVKKMGDCFDFFPTSSYSREKLTEIGDCLYVHYGDIHTKFHEFIDFNIEQLPFVTKEMAARFTKLEEGDLIIADASEDYEGVGKAVEVINLQDKKAISGLHTLHLRSKDECFANGFKGYVLNNDKVRLDILRSTTGIKVYSISKSGLKRILLPRPPKAEQEAIALILSKVDDTIRAANKAIKAAEKLKLGFIQNLLSGKLKADGTWRKEEEFSYDEKVGYYPIEWNCNRFKEFSVLQRGKDLTDNDVVDGVYPVVKSNGTTIHHNQFTCEPPGVVTGRSGTIGKVFFLEEKFWAHNTTLYVKDFKGNHEKYIFYLIQTMRFEKYYAGTTVPTLNRNDIHRVRVAIPKSIEEQKEICKLIDNVDNIINDKRTKIKKLQRLKKSLMQNLLTGKVRVDVNKIENF
jgi:type I restriction enzyme S subunit